MRKKKKCGMYLIVLLTTLTLAVAHDSIRKKNSIKHTSSHHKTRKRDQIPIKLHERTIISTEVIANPFKLSNTTQNEITQTPRVQKDIMTDNQYANLDPFAYSGVHKQLYNSGVQQQQQQQQQLYSNVVENESRETKTGEKRNSLKETNVAFYGNSLLQNNTTDVKNKIKPLYTSSEDGSGSPPKEKESNSQTEESDKKKPPSKETTATVEVSEKEKTPYSENYYGSKSRPAKSCRDIFLTDRSTPSGNYWIKTADGELLMIYCMRSLYFEIKTPKKPTFNPPTGPAINLVEINDDDPDQPPAAISSAANPVSSVANPGKDIPEMKNFMEANNITVPKLPKNVNMVNVEKDNKTLALLNPAPAIRPAGTAESMHAVYPHKPTASAFVKQNPTSAQLPVAPLLARPPYPTEAPPTPKKQFAPTTRHSTTHPPTRKQNPTVSAKEKEQWTTMKMVQDAKSTAGFHPTQSAAGVLPTQIPTHRVTEAPLATNTKKARPDTLEDYEDLITREKLQQKLTKQKQALAAASEKVKQTENMFQVSDLVPSVEGKPIASRAFSQANIAEVNSGLISNFNAATTMNRVNKTVLSFNNTPDNLDNKMFNMERPSPLLKKESDPKPFMMMNGMSSKDYLQRYAETQTNKDIHIQKADLGSSVESVQPPQQTQGVSKQAGKSTGTSTNQLEITVTPQVPISMYGKSIDYPSISNNFMSSTAIENIGTTGTNAAEIMKVDLASKEQPQLNLPLEIMGQVTSDKETGRTAPISGIILPNEEVKKGEKQKAFSNVKGLGIAGDLGDLPDDLPPDPGASINQMQSIYGGINLHTKDETKEHDHALESKLIGNPDHSITKDYKAAMEFETQPQVRSWANRENKMIERHRFHDQYKDFEQIDKKPDPYKPEASFNEKAQARSWADNRYEMKNKLIEDQYNSFEKTEKEIKQEQERKTFTQQYNDFEPKNSTHTSSNASVIDATLGKIDNSTSMIQTQNDTNKANATLEKQDEVKESTKMDKGKDSTQHPKTANHGNNKTSNLTSNENVSNANLTSNSVQNNTHEMLKISDGKPAMYANAPLGTTESNATKVERIGDHDEKVREANATVVLTGKKRYPGKVDVNELLTNPQPTGVSAKKDVVYDDDVDEIMDNFFRNHSDTSDDMLDTRDTGRGVGHKLKQLSGPPNPSINDDLGDEKESAKQEEAEEQNDGGDKKHEIQEGNEKTKEEKHMLYLKLQPAVKTENNVGKEETPEHEQTSPIDSANEHERLVKTDEGTSKPSNIYVDNRVFIYGGVKPGSNSNPPVISQGISKKDEGGGEETIERKLKLEPSSDLIYTSKISRKGSSKSDIIQTDGNQDFTQNIEEQHLQAVDSLDKKFSLNNILKGSNLSIENHVHSHGTLKTYVSAPGEEHRVEKTTKLQLHTIPNKYNFLVPETKKFSNGKDDEGLLQKIHGVERRHETRPGKKLQIEAQEKERIKLIKAQALSRSDPPMGKFSTANLKVFAYKPSPTARAFEAAEAISPTNALQVVDKSSYFDDYARPKPSIAKKGKPRVSKAKKRYDYLLLSETHGRGEIAGTDNIRKTSKLPLKVVSQPATFTQQTTEQPTWQQVDLQSYQIPDNEPIIQDPVPITSSSYAKPTQQHNTESPREDYAQTKEAVPTPLRYPGISQPVQEDIPSDPVKKTKLINYVKSLFLQREKPVKAEKKTFVQAIPQKPQSTEAEKKAINVSVPQQSTETAKLHATSRLKSKSTNYVQEDDEDVTETAAKKDKHQNLQAESKDIESGKKRKYISPVDQEQLPGADDILDIGDDTSQKWNVQGVNQPLRVVGINMQDMITSAQNNMKHIPGYDKKAREEERKAKEQASGKVSHDPKQTFISDKKKKDSKQENVKEADTKQNKEKKREKKQNKKHKDEKQSYSSSVNQEKLPGLDKRNHITTPAMQKKIWKNLYIPNNNGGYDVDDSDWIEGLEQEYLYSRPTEKKSFVPNPNSAQTFYKGNHYKRGLKRRKYHRNSRRHLSRRQTIILTKVYSEGNNKTIDGNRGSASSYKMYQNGSQSAVKDVKKALKSHSSADMTGSKRNLDFKLRNSEVNQSNKLSLNQRRHHFSQQNPHRKKIKTKNEFLRDADINNLNLFSHENTPAMSKVEGLLPVNMESFYKSRANSVFQTHRRLHSQRQPINKHLLNVSNVNQFDVDSQNTLHIKYNLKPLTRANAMKYPKPTVKSFHRKHAKRNQHMKRVRHKKHIKRQKLHKQTLVKSAKREENAMTRSNQVSNILGEENSVDGNSPNQTLVGIISIAPVSNFSTNENNTLTATYNMKAIHETMNNTVSGSNGTKQANITQGMDGSKWSQVKQLQVEVEKNTTQNVTTGTLNNTTDLVNIMNNAKNVTQDNDLVTEDNQQQHSNTSDSQNTSTILNLEGITGHTIDENNTLTAIYNMQKNMENDNKTDPVDDQRTDEEVEHKVDRLISTLRKHKTSTTGKKRQKTENSTLHVTNVNDYNTTDDTVTIIYNLQGANQTINTTQKNNSTQTTGRNITGLIDQLSPKEISDENNQIPYVTETFDDIVNTTNTNQSESSAKNNSIATNNNTIPMNNSHNTTLNEMQNTSTKNTNNATNYSILNHTSNIMQKTNTLEEKHGSKKHFLDVKQDVSSTYRKYNVVSRRKDLKHILFNGVFPEPLDSRELQTRQKVEVRRPFEEEKLSGSRARAFRNKILKKRGNMHDKVKNREMIYEHLLGELSDMKRKRRRKDVSSLKKRSRREIRSKTKRERRKSKNKSLKQTSLKRDNKRIVQCSKHDRKDCITFPNVHDYKVSYGDHPILHVISNMKKLIKHHKVLKQKKQRTKRTSTKLTEVRPRDLIPSRIGQLQPSNLHPLPPVGHDPDESPGPPQTNEKTEQVFSPDGHTTNQAGPHPELQQQEPHEKPVDQHTHTTTQDNANESQHSPVATSSTNGAQQNNDGAPYPSESPPVGPNGKPHADSGPQEEKIAETGPNLPPEPPTNATAPNVGDSGKDEVGTGANRLTNNDYPKPQVLANDTEPVGKDKKVVDTTFEAGLQDNEKSKQQTGRNQGDGTNSGNLDLGAQQLAQTPTIPSASDLGNLTTFNQAINVTALELGIMQLLNQTAPKLKTSEDHKEEVQQKLNKKYPELKLPTKQGEYIPQEDEENESPKENENHMNNPTKAPVTSMQKHGKHGALNPPLPPRLAPKIKPEEDEQINVIDSTPTETGSNEQYEEASNTDTTEESPANPEHTGHTQEDKEHSEGNVNDDQHEETTHSEHNAQQTQQTELKQGENLPIFNKENTGEVNENNGGNENHGGNDNHDGNENHGGSENHGGNEQPQLSHNTNGDHENNNNASESHSHQAVNTGSKEAHPGGSLLPIAIPTQGNTPAVPLIPIPMDSPLGKLLYPALEQAPGNKGVQNTSTNASMDSQGNTQLVIDQTNKLLQQRKLEPSDLMKLLRVSRKQTISLKPTAKDNIAHTVNKLTKNKTVLKSSIQDKGSIHVSLKTKNGHLILVPDQKEAYQRKFVPQNVNLDMLHYAFNENSNKQIVQSIKRSQITSNKT